MLAGFPLYAGLKGEDLAGPPPASACLSSVSPCAPPRRAYDPPVRPSARSAGAHRVSVADG
jgi:hypothetical protein